VTSRRARRGAKAIALRDFGLMLAALTLARLASVYDAPIRFGPPQAASPTGSRRRIGMSQRIGAATIAVAPRASAATPIESSA
jgi:hypothetical protein